MTIRDAIGKQEDKIPVKSVLLSVSNKGGLETFIPGLMEVSPKIIFMSTGGTYKTVKEILGADAADHLIEVAKYTEFPEMQGGLVKTLHPKIHAGILGERNNPDHQEYIRDLTKTVEFLDSDVKRVFDAEIGKEYRVQVIEGITGVYIDMVVVNLYPFKDMVAKVKSGEINPKTEKPYNFESARGNIDIGGPTMDRAGAKNFLSCAVVCDPGDYEKILADVKANDGCTTFDQRLALARDVFEMSWRYDKDVAKFMTEEINDNPDGIRACYEFTKEGE